MRLPRQILKVNLKKNVSLPLKPMTDAPIPVDIQPLQDGLEILITWNDDSRSVMAACELRWHCPCAQCVDEMSGKRLLRNKEDYQRVLIKQMEPVGRYALRFLFSDRHNTGIYSYSYLKTLSTT